MARRGRHPVVGAGNGIPESVSSVIRAGVVRVEVRGASTGRHVVRGAGSGRDVATAVRARRRRTAAGRQDRRRPEVGIPRRKAGHAVFRGVGEVGVDREAGHRQLGTRAADEIRRHPRAVHSGHEGRREQGAPGGREVVMGTYRPILLVLAMGLAGAAQQPSDAVTRTKATVEKTRSQRSYSVTFIARIKIPDSDAMILEGETVWVSPGVQIGRASWR